MEELTENERVFLEEAHKQLKEHPHPRGEVLDEPIQQRLGATSFPELEKFLEPRNSLAEKGLLDSQVAVSSGVVRITQAGMNKAEELFGSD